MIFVYRYEYDAAGAPLFAGRVEPRPPAARKLRGSAFVLRSIRSARNLYALPVLTFNLRVLTFEASVADRPNLLDLTTAQMLRSGAVTGAHE